MDYELCLCLRDVKLGMLDNLLLGKDAAHSFLALRDIRSGDILSEMHGYAYKPREGLFGGMDASIAGLFDVAASMRDAFGNHNRAAISGDDDRHKLKGYVSRGAWRADKDAFITPIGEVPVQGAIRLWGRMGTLLQKINQRNLDYVMIAPNGRSSNCHMVTGMLVNLAEREHPGVKARFETAIENAPMALPGLDGKAADVFMMRSLFPEQTAFSAAVLETIDTALDMICLATQDSLAGLKGFNEGLPTPSCFRPLQRP